RITGLPCRPRHRPALPPARVRVGRPPPSRPALPCPASPERPSRESPMSTLPLRMDVLLPAETRVPRTLQVQALAQRLLASFGLHDWSFAFNRRKAAMGMCYYHCRTIELSIHFVERNN